MTDSRLRAFLRRIMELEIDIRTMRTEIARDQARRELATLRTRLHGGHVR